MEKIDYKKDCFVEEINKLTAKRMVAQYHYLGDKAFMYSKAYGLFQRKAELNILIGVAVFSPVTGIVALRSWFGVSNQEGEGLYELIRLVMHPTHNGRNGTSFLLGRALRLLKKTGAKGVVSLADSEHHTGYVYQATNFKYYGLTNKKTDFYSACGKLNPRGETRTREGVWIERSQKHRYLFKFDETLNVTLKEQPYPKQHFTDIRCCVQGIVEDKRFNKKYKCPRCTTKGKLLEITE